MENWQKWYVGGLWDADGSFGIAKRSGRYEAYQPFALITLCDPKSEIIGGLIEKYFGFKCVWEGRRDNPKWKIAYRWMLYSQVACDFAKTIEPYLLVKKERAQILMEWPKIENKLAFIDRVPIHEKQKELYERMKILNKRGAL